jgi:NTE family protein
VTTAFVLSGGGSLGAVQVGMLHALRERGVRPDLLVGTSAGAVNALWVAHHGMSVGSLNRLAGIWTRLRRKDVFPVRPKAVAHGIVGRASAVLSSDRLGALVEAHAGIGDLGDADIPVHLLATDLLSGGCVAISAGPVGDAVRASAAIPGVFPPVWLDGRWLVDGAMAANAGVSQAVRLGATVVYVLPTGVPCALAGPPRSALGVAMHAVSLLVQQRLIDEVGDPTSAAMVKLVPPLCPVSVSATDFGHAHELIRRAKRASAAWLDDGSVDLPHAERFLSLHHHGTDEHRRTFGSPGGSEERHSA